MLVVGKKPSEFDHIWNKYAARKGAREGFGVGDKYLQQDTKYEDDVLMEEDTACFIVGARCRACRSTKGFARGTDSSQSCVECGVVNEEREFVSLSHVKACPASDDPTTTADDSHTVSYGSCSVEAASQTTSRHAYDAGGSLLSTRAKRRLGVTHAASEVKRQAVQDHRANVKVSQASDRFNRATQLALHKFFQTVSAHESLLSHIRKTAFDVIVRSQEHAQICDPTTCDLNVTNAPAGVFAVMLVRVLCENLAQSRASAIPEVGKLDLFKLIDAANGATLRQDRGITVSRTIQAITLTLAMTDTTSACRAGKATQTLTLTNSPSVKSCTDKPIYALRDAVWASYNLLHFSSSLRDHTLRCLGTGCIESWLRTSTFSCDVSASVLLAACAEIRMQHDSNSTIRRRDAQMTATHVEATSKACQVASSLVAGMSKQVVQYLDCMMHDDDEL